MKKIIECVPNFSEGQNPEVINAIADAIKKTPGVTLLDVDPGKSTHRTVYTFVGDEKAVVEGALSAARAARKLIDMRNHKGEHPRMGALDVCPFIPIANATMDDCVNCAKEFGKRAAEELGIPIYLYEHASEQPHRKTLPQIRDGEYEGLSEKIKKPEWKPDFGPAQFIPEWGASVTGARFFLLAYNVNILGTKQQAHRIALNLREGGRGPNEPGKLKECKAIGWTLDEHNISQISINLTNYRITPLHTTYEEAAQNARELRVAAAGSEIVGLIPLEAMMLSAEYYIKKEGLFIIDPEQKIKLVVDRLGLNSISRFEPKKRIIEYLIAEQNSEPLAQLSVKAFVRSVAARTAAPGGGSVSALLAALGSGLATMVSQLMYGIKKYDHLDSEMRRLIPPLYHATEALIPMIDADTNAFNDYVTASRMPQTTESQKKERHAAMQAGLKKAIEIPFQTMRLGDDCWETMLELAKVVNLASKSDLEVGARALETGIWGAYRNVLINMPSIEDQNFKTAQLQKAEKIMERAKKNCQAILDLLDSRKE